MHYADSNLVYIYKYTKLGNREYLVHLYKKKRTIGID